MLNPFPELLAFRLLAPVVLRIALGIYVAYLGYKKLGAGRQAVASFFESLGLQPARYYARTLAIAEIALGTLIFLGAFTQIAAAIIAVIMLVSIIVSSKHPGGGFNKPSEYALLLAISLALIFTGAGLFAIDWPL